MTARWVGYTVWLDGARGTWAVSSTTSQQMSAPIIDATERGTVMKITVDESGNVEPAGAAHILAIVNETTDVTEGRPMSEKVAWRTFQCSYCNHAFEARAGNVTTHECES